MKALHCVVIGVWSDIITTDCELRILIHLPSRRKCPSGGRESWSESRTWSSRLATVRESSDRSECSASRGSSGSSRPWSCGRTWNSSRRPSSPESRSVVFQASQPEKIDWLVGWLVGWLIDWLIDCLIDWLTALRHISRERLLVPRNVAK